LRSSRAKWLSPVWAASITLEPPPQKHWGSLSLTAAMSRLLSLHNAVDGLATTTPEILAHPEVAKAIEQELARALIACLSGTVSTESRQPLRGIVMQRFEQMIEVHRDKPLYLTDVCAALGVSGRTLRWYCQELLGMGPQRYLWLRHMHLVRRALTLARPGQDRRDHNRQRPRLRRTRTFCCYVPANVRRGTVYDVAPVSLTQDGWGAGIPGARFTRARLTTHPAGRI